jgi:hypothetical protein
MLCTVPDAGNWGLEADRRLLPASSKAALTDGTSGWEHASAAIVERAAPRQPADRVRAAIRNVNRSAWVPYAASECPGLKIGDDGTAGDTVDHSHSSTLDRDTQRVLPRLGERS